MEGLEAYSPEERLLRLIIGKSEPKPGQESISSGPEDFISKKLPIKKSTTKPILERQAFKKEKVSSLALREKATVPATPYSTDNIPKVQIKEDKVFIQSNYCPYPNDIDELIPYWKKAEEIVYRALFKQSFGWGRTSCRISPLRLTQITTIKSATTIKKALKGLLTKKHILHIVDTNGKYFDNQKGVNYRVLLPHEILNKKTYEGFDLKNISSIKEIDLKKFDQTKFDWSIFTQTDNDKTKFVQTEINRTRIDQTKNDQSENDETESDWSKTTLSDWVENDQTENDQTKEKLLKIKDLDNDQVENDQTENDHIINNNIKNININNNRDAAVVLDVFNKFFPKYNGSLAYKTALELIKEYGVDSIVINLGRIKEKKRLTNPAGLLIDSLKRGWQLPPTEEEIIKEERRKIEEMGEIERKKREEEIKEIKKERKERERLEARFKRLPQKEQEELKEKARELLKEENKGIGEEGLRFILSREMIVLHKTLELIKEE